MYEIDNILRDENGEPVLDGNGDWILAEISCRVLLDSEGDPILDENGEWIIAEGYRDIVLPVLPFAVAVDGYAGLTEYLAGMTAEPESIGITGTDLVAHHLPQTEDGSLAATGADGDLKAVRLGFADPAAFAVSGRPSGFHLGVDGAAGDVALTGVDALLAFTRGMAADGNVVVITASSLVAHHNPAIIPGSVALTGAEMQLTAAHRVNAETGQAVITGADTGAATTRRLNLESASTLITGVDIAAAAVRGLLGEVGEYAVDGAEAEGYYLQAVPAYPGATVVSGVAASAIRVALLGLTPGEYTTTGLDVLDTLGYGTNAEPAATDITGYQLVDNVLRDENGEPILDSDGSLIFTSLSITFNLEPESYAVSGVAAYDNILRDENGEPILDSDGNLIFTSSDSFPSAGIYEIGGKQAGTRAIRRLSLDAGSLSITGIDASLYVPFTCEAEAGTIACLGSDAGLAAVREVGLDAGQVVVTGIAADLYSTDAEQILDADSDLVAIVGQPAFTARTVIATADPASHDITGADAETFKTNWAIGADFLPMGITGIDALPVYARVNLEAEPAGVEISGRVAWSQIRAIAGPYLFDLTGSPAITAKATLFAADPATYLLAGFESEAADRRSINAETGEFAVSGAETSEEILRRMTAEVGAVDIDGAETDMAAPRMLSADLGEMVLTGADATLDLVSVDLSVIAEPGVHLLGPLDLTALYNREVPLDPEDVVITGIDAEIWKGVGLELDPESYAVTGAEASVAPTRGMTAETESFGITGSEAEGFLARVVPILAGGIVVSGLDAELSRTLDFRFIPEPGTHTTTGEDATLWLDRAIVAETGEIDLTWPDTLLTYKQVEPQEPEYEFFRGLVQSGFYEIAMPVEFVPADKDMVSHKDRIEMVSARVRTTRIFFDEVER